jgi:hypothetical protein
MLSRPFLPSPLPQPHRSGIKHLVVVMMENRSFDHMLGWQPAADARQAGLAYLDASGVPHETQPLAPDFQGCEPLPPSLRPDRSHDEFIRDQHASHLGQTAPSYPIDPGPHAAFCPWFERNKWEMLRTIAVASGFTRSHGVP